MTYEVYCRNLSQKLKITVHLETNVYFQKYTHFPHTVRTYVTGLLRPGAVHLITVCSYALMKKSNMMLISNQKIKSHLMQWIEQKDRLI